MSLVCMQSCRSFVHMPVGLCVVPQGPISVVVIKSLDVKIMHDSMLALVKNLGIRMLW